MKRDVIYSLLGLSARMRKLSYGKERIRAYMRSPRRKKLVIVAEDASSRLKKDLKIRSECTGTKLIVMFKKNELGKLLGRNEISSVAIEDDSIIDGIEEKLRG